MTDAERTMSDTDKLAVMELVNTLMVYRTLRDAPVRARGFDALERKREERDQALTLATAHLDRAIGGALAICKK